MRRRASTLRGFSEPRTIRWPSFDGRTISGLLTLPPERHHRRARFSC
jgi:dipeptidyl aminopeptidase/acylaminoacyl peptidase